MNTVLLNISEFDPVLYKIVLLAAGIIVAGIILKTLGQPYIIAYIIAGVALGPHGMSLITEESVITGLGSFGLILLLFFIGMEISLPQLIANWKVSIIGTLAQVTISVILSYVVGSYLDWPINRIIMLGFVISLSSTAVVIKLLQERSEINSSVGQNVIGILLAQDVIVIPMLIVLNYLGGENPSMGMIWKQVLGGILIIGSIWVVIKKKKISLPFQAFIRRDHEIQVFMAILFCFGFSLISAFFGLSSALGAFAAGIIVSALRATQWVHDSLHAFRVVFVAVFFISIGMLIDLNFIKDHLSIIMPFVFIVLIANNIINALVFKLFKQTWRDSIYAGAILSQIGEFSFILGSTGFLMGIITANTYALIISIISITLVVSPIWISLIRAFLHPDLRDDIDKNVIKRIFKN